MTEMQGLCEERFGDTVRYEEYGWVEDQDYLRRTRIICRGPGLSVEEIKIICGEPGLYVEETKIICERPRLTVEE